MREKVGKIKEYVWSKYVDYAQPPSEIDEIEAMGILAQYFSTVDPEEDPESYYLGILLFERAFLDESNQNHFLAKAKTIFERYRTRTGETDWDVVEDRLEEIDDSLSGLGPDERADVFARAEEEVTIGGGSAVTRQEAIAVIEGMVLVAGGAFLSGPDNGEAEVESFYIDIFPITNADYRKFMEATGYRPPKFWSEDRLKDDTAPVVGVSWYDADKYATWAGKELPSANQWEKAARGIEGRVFPWGDEIDESKANYGHMAGTDHVTPVDQFEENRSVFGARELAGNVWEWTKDWDKIEIDMKMIMGGSWVDPEQFLRCDRHLFANPKDKYDNIGFRCVRPAD